jgi:hypothetical protein
MPTGPVTAESEERCGRRCMYRMGLHKSEENESKWCGCMILSDVKFRGQVREYGEVILE